MNKFFAKKLKEQTFSFCENDVNHIINVLRLTISDQIIVIFDSRKFLCEIVNISPLLARIVKEIPNNSDLQGVNIAMFQAIIKPKNFELVLTKCTELGANEFHPIVFQRTQFNNIEKYDRYSNILSSACKQCGRTQIPKLYKQTSFIDMVHELTNYDIVIVANEHDSYSKNDLLSLVLSEQFSNYSNVAIIIGPEGGYTDDEINILSRMKNVVLVGLTKSILKSETASWYALSIVISYFIYKGNK